MLVALLAEGVDRNPVMDNCHMDIYVALLAEGVDRNLNALNALSALVCRPPRGGRG